MSDDDLEAAVTEFLDATERVYDEYDDGYIDADAALSQLGDHVSTLRDAHEGE
ncbi:hypothetical protein SAMN04488065_0639 [Haloplanus vescus]|uniref:Uncharacterized protein n=1 Tax=Haloplanus vescus TaxID=555874 RepID=A0A1H3WA29_9EURY|nr:hypothetical protein [Haloplanus vescus]SDZ83192.1 hypothetical protein SAMN04488065_0639 [Haloplanus vescus]